MRIAQIASLWERVPPPAYGGSELVVSLLTDELVRRGHEVTLFGSGDSISLAKLNSFTQGLYGLTLLAVYTLCSDAINLYTVLSFSRINCAYDL